MRTNKKKCCRRIKKKMIEDETVRQVIFTKRYQALCRKVSKLGILYGGQYAIIAHSPRGDPVTFAYPSGPVDPIIEQFITDKASEEDAASVAPIDEPERGHEDAVPRLKESSKQGSQTAKTGAAPQGWWNEPVDTKGMGVDELKAYMQSLQAAKMKVLNRLAVLKGQRKTVEAHTSKSMIENDGRGEKANKTEVEENEIKGAEGHSDLGVNLGSPEDDHEDGEDKGPKELKAARSSCI